MTLISGKGIASPEFPNGIRDKFGKEYCVPDFLRAAEGVL
jgi:hypothetical protein